MAYETIKLLPTSRTSDAGGASMYASSLKAKGIIQRWDLTKGEPGISISLYPAMAGVVKGDYEGYRENILTGFATYGYALPTVMDEADTTAEDAYIPTTVTITDAPSPVDEPGN